MKIVFCIDSLNKGGAERVISNLANGMCKANDIAIITTSSTKSMYKLDDKIKLYSLDDNGSKKILRIHNLYKIMKSINPDIVVCFMPSQSFRVLLIKKVLKLKVIVSVRNDPKMEFKSLKYKFFMKLLYNSADGFVFQTEDAKKYFNKEIQNKSVIIPNPINKKFLLEELNVGERKKTIVTVGRLEKQKNHELLIDAFYYIHKKIDDYKLIIYGDGSLKNKLENKIADLKMNDRIILAGTCDNLEKTIKDSAIFVLSSDYEGMPNALMEAMALGIVSISTDCPCGGPSFLIKDGVNGFLVNVGDKEQLSNRILYIINNLSKKQYNDISINSRNCMSRLNEKNINKEWYDYIKKIVEK